MSSEDGIYHSSHRKGENIQHFEGWVLKILHYDFYDKGGKSFFFQTRKKIVHVLLDLNILKHLDKKNNLMKTCKNILGRKLSSVPCSTKLCKTKISYSVYHFINRFSVQITYSGTSAPPTEDEVSIIPSHPCWGGRQARHIEEDMKE